MCMENYEEYEELFENWSAKELKLAYKMLGNLELQDEVQENNSTLLMFLTDTRLQELLFLYAEDNPDMVA